MMPSSPARVLLADPEVLFRHALRIALEDDGTGLVVAEVSTGAAALDEVVQARPHVAIVAARLADMSGTQLCARLQDASPSCRTVIIDDAPHHSVLVAAFQAGAGGYLSRDLGFDEFLVSARTVLDGGAYVPPQMLGGLLHDLVQQRRAANTGIRRLADLSRREREVLGLLSRGYEVSAIAAELVISIQTARTHIQNVMGKLGVHSRVEAAAFAHEHRFVELLTAE
jgi:DNA-binding NarL/FixJ family response regulator